jgi:hypothetical protein
MKCDECKKIIEKEVIVEIIVDYCDKCKSDLPVQYSFCTKECAIKFLQEYD